MVQFAYITYSVIWVDALSTQQVHVIGELAFHVSEVIEIVLFCVGFAN